MKKTKQMKISLLCMMTLFMALSFNPVIMSDALAEANISVSPLSHNFDSTDVGAESSSQFFVISNIGTSDLTINSVTLTGTDSEDFEIQSDPCSGNLIESSGMCMVKVVFSPQSGGSKTANLEFLSDDPDTATFIISLSGTGIQQTAEEPVISASPMSYDFGSVTVGTPSSAHTFEISNNGTAELAINTITLKGIHATSFDIQNYECAGKSIAPSASCPIQAVFAPFSEGSKTAEIEIISNDSDTPILIISLSGTSIQEAAQNISVDPVSYDFSSTKVGQSSANDFTVSNTGTASLVIGTLTIAGTNTADFVIQSNTCDGKTLTPAETCSFKALFSPKTEGIKIASVEVPSNDPDTPKLTVSLSGTATQDITADKPDISVTPVSYDFGSVGIGKTSQVKSFQITNTGKANLMTGTISLTGSNSAEFSIQNFDCSWKNIAPSESCTMNLLFSPVSKGGKNANLEILSNASDNATQIPLSGTGIKIWTVCASGCEYSKIQPAIDAASNGDTILVGKGTYSEDIDFKGKFLTLTVQSGEGSAEDICDFNGDGKLGLEDALYILQVLVGLQ